MRTSLTRATPTSRYTPTPLSPAPLHVAAVHAQVPFAGVLLVRVDYTVLTSPSPWCRSRRILGCNQTVHCVEHTVRKTAQTTHPTAHTTRHTPHTTHHTPHTTQRRHAHTVHGIRHTAHVSRVTRHASRVIVLVLVPLPHPPASSGRRYRCHHANQP